MTRAVTKGVIPAVGLGTRLAQRVGRLPDGL